MFKKKISRALSFIDLSASVITTFFHQHDAKKHTNKVFKQLMGSPVGGCLTLIYVVTVISLLATRFSSMDSGDLDYVFQNYKPITTVPVATLKSNLNLRVNIINYGLKDGVFEKYGLRNEKG